MNDPITLLLTLVAIIGGGGGIYSIATVGVTKRKMLADTEATKAGTVAVLGKTAVELLEPLRSRIHELENEVDQLRLRVRQANDALDSRDQRIGTLEATVAIQQVEIARLQQMVQNMTQGATNNVD